MGNGVAVADSNSLDLDAVTIPVWINPGWLINTTAKQQQTSRHKLRGLLNF
jgi:hypothetical protein